MSTDPTRPAPATGATDAPGAPAAPGLPGATDVLPADLLPARRGVWLRAALTAATAALLALAVLGGPGLVAVPVALAAILLGVGLPRLLDLPHGTGTAWVLTLAAPLVTVAVWFGGTGTRVLLIAGGVILAFVHQMVRRDGRPRLTESVAGDVLGLVLMVFGTGWFIAAREPGGDTWVLIGAATLSVGVACGALPVGSAPAAALAGTVGAGAGAALAAVLEPVAWWQGALLGLFVGVVAAALQRASARSPSSARMRPALAAAMIPVLATGAFVVAVLLVTR